MRTRYVHCFLFVRRFFECGYVPRQRIAPMTVWLLFVAISLLAVETAQANHPDVTPGCPDVETYGPQTLQPEFKNISAGEPLRDGQIVALGTKVKIDAVTTADGMCEKWYMSGGQCVMYSSEPVYPGGLKGYVTWRANSKSGMLYTGTYPMGQVTGRTPDTHTLDSQSPYAAGEMDMTISFIGMHRLRVDATSTSTGCSMNIMTMRESITIYGHDSTDDENLGCKVGESVGDPCNAKTGNNYQREVDVEAGTLDFIRFYNSKLPADFGMGIGWTTRYHRRIERQSSKAWSRRADGSVEPFAKDATGWHSEADSTSSLTEDANGYILTRKDGSTEQYDLNGQLLSEVDRRDRTTTYQYSDDDLIGVTGPYGHTMAFTYDQDGHVATVTDVAGRVHTYSYDGNGNLAQVTRPDNTTRRYHYENTKYLNYLTGITDENNSRFATIAYDSDGRASSTEHAGGAERVTLGSYSTVGTTGSTVVTDTFGIARTYSFKKVLGQWKLAGISGQPCDHCRGAKALTYDANGNIASRTDYNNRVTTFAYDASRNLETSRTEASGTPQSRTITTQWHPNIDLPTQISEPNRVTTFSYDAHGNILQKTIWANGQSRSWTYTYNSIGQVLTQDGPRTDAADVTSYTYDSQGNLATVTNALGHKTSIGFYPVFTDGCETANSL